MEDWKPWKEGGCGGVADKVAPRRVQSAEARRRDGGWLGFLSVFAPSRLPTASVGRGPEFYAIECVRPPVRPNSLPSRGRTSRSLPTCLPD